MGRHSRKDLAAPPRPVRGDHGEPGTADRPSGGHPEPAARRRGPEPTTGHQGYVNQPAPGVRAGHPEIHEPGGAYGDLRAATRSHPAPTHPAPGHPASGHSAPVPSTPGHAAPVEAVVPVPPAPAVPFSAFGLVTDTDTPDFGAPATGFPRVTLPTPPSTRPERRTEDTPVTSTGSHRRVPTPRRTPRTPPAERPGSARRRKVRTYTGMAAAAVTTVLAVVVAGQVSGEDPATQLGAQSAGEPGGSRALPGQSAASRSDGRATPDAPAAGGGAPAVATTYEQKMAEPHPIDAKLVGSGAFSTVGTGAPAPGKGKLVHYRVDVEQGLDLDADLFAEAVQRTLNDPRSWAHDGDMTFERVPSGDAQFVITLASPGTTGAWCAKSGLDTTVDNVSCDSASTDRVMINAFRWAQGSPTYGQDQMLAYRQMLINHEVGHRLGHDHVSCRTPGALAPIMQQQTKSLDIDGISCKPNPWVYPVS
ncbi:DUF3152 domain-containing protein [Streptomyces sp. G-G2]|uniref:DUF3152 domain-containing protein n=1 Tax=Streptomyces sp. G-G2 TaxID=3046201 RepID=UPI0024B92EEF|nr:DUF3152 domain-containing protein [Streptomyces sp. G-G2]MDJ0384415.1 DUF3152 domain-containing protein [Streptomyces sp. G-G2]